MASISFLYKGSLSDGTIFDNAEGEPHTIVTGRSQVMPTLEKNLLEMEIGEERIVDLFAEDAYGSYEEKNVERVPLSLIPDGENLPQGEIIHWTSPRNNKPIPVRIRSIQNGVAELDFNHPLAGKNLTYWIKVTARST